MPKKKPNAKAETLTGTAHYRAKGLVSIVVMVTDDERRAVKSVAALKKQSMPEYIRSLIVSNEDVAETLGKF